MKRDPYAFAMEQFIETGMAVVDQLTEPERDKLSKWALKTVVHPLTGKKVNSVLRCASFMEFDNRWHDVMIGRNLNL